jgi:hypothetical protein
MEIKSTLQVVAIYGYYVSQVLMVLGFSILAWRRRSRALLIAAIGFAGFLLGNLEMIDADRRLVEARQLHLDVAAYEHTYLAWRLVSALGLLIGSFAVVVGAFLFPRKTE